MTKFLHNDVKKTLQILQECGNKGIHSFQLNHLVGTTRSAARINDLKKLGYQIESKFEELNGCRGVRYFLITSPIEEPKKELKLIFDNTTNSCRWEYV